MNKVTDNEPLTLARFRQLLFVSMVSQRTYMLLATIVI